MVFLLNFFWNLLSGGKCLCNKDRKSFPFFVTRFALHGGLNHIIFLFWFLVVVVFCLMFCWYLISCLYSAFLSDSFYSLIDFLNIFSLADNCENRSSIDFSSCFIIDRGWLDYCFCLLGKEGMMSFPSLSWCLGNSLNFSCIKL